MLCGNLRLHTLFREGGVRRRGEGWNRSLTESEGWSRVNWGAGMMTREKVGWCWWQKARGKIMRGDKEQRLWNLGPYGRQEGPSLLKLQIGLTSLIDEEMPKCIWEPLFALLPTDRDAEWDHLSQESLLGLPRCVSDSLSLSLSLPWVLHHAQATWILSRDEAKLVCKLSLSEIKTQLKPHDWKPKRV